MREVFVIMKYQDWKDAYTVDSIYKSRTSAENEIETRPWSETLHIKTWKVK